MVELRRETGEGPVISAIGPQGFRVANRIVPGGLLLLPDDARDFAAPAWDELNLKHLHEAMAMAPLPEFILFGSGSTLRRPARALIKALEGKGIGFEAMDSRAAARAWALLRAEERWIAGYFWPIAR